MKPNRLINIFLAIVLLSGVWGFILPAPAQAARNPAESELAPLLLLNRAMGRVEVKFTGPKSYTFYLDPNVKTKVEMAKGKYNYSYQACGTKQKGTISVPQIKKFMTIKCTLAKVTVINYTGHPFDLKLFGPADYRFTIQPGNNKITVLKGTYAYIGVTQFCGGGKTKGGNKFQLTNGVRWPWICGASN